MHCLQPSGHWPVANHAALWSQDLPFSSQSPLDSIAVSVFVLSFTCIYLSLTNTWQSETRTKEILIGRRAGLSMLGPKNGSGTHFLLNKRHSPPNPLFIFLDGSNHKWSKLSWLLQSKGGKESGGAKMAICLLKIFLKGSQLWTRELPRHQSGIW